MRAWLVFLAFFVMGSGGVHVHAAEPLRVEEIRGTVQQWAPGARVLNLSGRTYRLAPGVQVLDRNARLLRPGAVRPGIAVQLVVANGEVTHVVVGPGPGPAMDMPQR